MSAQRVLGSALLLGLLSCTGEPSSQAATDEEAAALADELEVPSEEEAQARADESIDESNADEEFAKLKAEIEADTSDF